MGAGVYDGPDKALVEAICVKLHEKMVATKTAEGVTTQKFGEEELLVPYAELGDISKNMTRESVTATLIAIEAAGYTVSKKGA